MALKISYSLRKKSPKKPSVVGLMCDNLLMDFKGPKDAALWPFRLSNL